jgi:hypothetical protein
MQVQHQRPGIADLLDPLESHGLVESERKVVLLDTETQRSVAIRAGEIEKCVEESPTHSSSSP